MPNAYDIVAYPGAPHEQTHPATLGVFAALAGLPFKPFAACRVLEIGCGDGVNLIAMALGAPGARFVGVDLAEAPIRRARADAAVCGLANVEFHARDLGGIDASFGEFDYIVAHGVLAWVPAEVRGALFRVAGERLAPGGLAMISYNVSPGSRLRQTLRDMLLHETREARGPEEKLRLALAFLERSLSHWSETQADEKILIEETRRILARDPATLFHDEMAEVFAPQLFSDVVAKAASNGLDYLADARPANNAPSFTPSETYAALRAELGGDALRFEQQVDFLRLRRFRNSIFVKGARADLQRNPARLVGLWARGDLRRAEPDLSAPDQAVFEVGAKLRITTNDPALANFLSCLGEAFPQACPLDAAARDPALAEQIFRVFAGEVIRVSTAPLVVASAGGARPEANPLARVQAARGEAELTTGLHRILRIDDPAGRSLVPLLDGTRELSRLVDDWSATANLSAEQAREGLEELLPQLAHAGALTG